METTIDYIKELQLAVKSTESSLPYTAPEAIVDKLNLLANRASCIGAASALEHAEKTIAAKDARIAELEALRAKLNGSLNEALDAADSAEKQVAALRAALFAFLDADSDMLPPRVRTLVREARVVLADTEAASKRFVEVDSEEMRALIRRLIGSEQLNEDVDEDVDDIIASFKARRGVK